MDLVKVLVIPLVGVVLSIVGVTWFGWPLRTLLPGLCILGGLLFIETFTTEPGTHGWVLFRCFRCKTYGWRWRLVVVQIEASRGYEVINGHTMFVHRDARLAAMHKHCAEVELFRAAIRTAEG